MAEEAENDFFKAQAADLPSYGGTDEVVEGGADASESDDYEPSVTLTEDYPVPFVVSQEKPAASVPTTSLSESSLAPLTSISTHHSPSPAAVRLKSFSTPHPQPSSITPQQSQPRTIGGFVVDDEEEDEAEDEDGKDILDVYDAPEDSTGEAAAANVISQSHVNSSSTPHVPIHDATATSHDVSHGASDVVVIPTTVSSSNNAIQSGQSVTPIQASALNAIHISKVTDPPPTSAVPKTRLAHDIIGILEDRIKEDPRGDMAAWLELLNALKTRNKREEVRKTYDRYFKIFPMAAEQWTSYASWENENNQLYNMEQVFGKSLLTVPDVKLWSMYVNYIRRRNSMTTGDVAKSYKIISEAFTFALNNVGMDKDSGQLWQEFVEFVKSGPGVIGGVGWQDTQKMDALRTAYQKAIAVPMSALNTLWKEYDVFETGISKINGRKFLQERSPAYMSARTCYTQLQNMTRELERTTLPRIPPAPDSDGDLNYLHQVELWERWIRWEKDDNLVLKDEDLKAYRDRVIFVYRQALMSLQFWPEMWYNAAEFCFSNGADNDGLEFLYQGIAANPESCLLAFRLADQIELSTVSDTIADPGSRSRMQKVREPYDRVLDSLYELITKARKRESLDVREIEMTATHAHRISGTNGYPNEDEDRESPEAEAERQAAQNRIDVIKQGTAIQTSLIQKTLSFAWVALMRACRRIQGKGVEGERAGGFRTILTEARKRGKITSDVYIQSALIEYHCYKDNTARKIFERGIKLFPDDEVFALEYIKHLIAINDVTNARAVFETTVSRLTAKPATALKAKPIFAFLHEYESHFGEFSQVTKLEQRMRDLFPDDLGLKQFSQRFVSPVFDPTSVRLIISPQQSKPNDFVRPSIEASFHQGQSPQVPPVEAFSTDSPKRPFPADDSEDSQPRKVARGESPLKGAAGRRMDQQKRQNIGSYPTSSLSQVHPAPATPLPGQVNFLLSIIPRASTYIDARFDPAKLVELIRNTPIPPSITSRQPEPQTHPTWPSQFQQMPQQSAFQPPFMPGVAGQPQYGGQY